MELITKIDAGAGFSGGIVLPDLPQDSGTAFPEEWFFEAVTGGFCIL